MTSGRTTGAEEIEKILPRDGREWSLAELEACAKQLGMYTFAAKWQGVPRSIAAPAIIPVKPAGGRHFTSLVGRRRDQVLIVDPPFEPTWIPISQLQGELGWEGYALHVSADPLSILMLRLYMYARELAMAIVLCIGGGCAARMYYLRGRQKVEPLAASDA